MKMCFNWKVLAALGLVGLGLYLLAPRLAAGAAPLLLVAACPLSMILMMRGMSGGSRCDTDGNKSKGDKPESNAEVAKLRAEVAQLRDERANQAD